MPPLPQLNQQNLLQNSASSPNNNQQHLSKIPTTLRRYQRKSQNSNEKRRRLTLDLSLYTAQADEAIMFSSVNSNTTITSSTAITSSTTSTSSNSSNGGGGGCHYNLPPLPSPATPLPTSNTHSRVHSLSRSQTPTNNSSPMNGSMTTIFSGTTQTLPREKPLASPKCFGKNTHILKEEYDRERQRWEKKLEEAEQKLCEAAANNAELDREIITQIVSHQWTSRTLFDIHTTKYASNNAKPLIEQNKRLNDRLKAATTETKKLEQKMAFVQDEWLSLRDQYDRVLKENEALREQRAFPEKLEELGRYRNQVLEMSKCITALRQSAAEKDRRQEMLIIKLKRMRMRASGQQESDRQSCAAGSEGSVEDSGSLGLDTIAEDLDEDVDLSTELLLNGRGAIDNANHLEESTNHFREELDSFRKKERLLQQQLANVQSQNELLEFQLVELTEGRQQLENGEVTNMGNRKNSVGLNRKRALDPRKIEVLRGGMKRAFEFPLLGRPERCAIKQGLAAIESLQQREEESAAYNRQVGELSKSLNEKVHIIGDLNDKVAQLGAELDICRCQLATSQKEDVSLKAQNAEMTNEVKRLVEELERVKADLVRVLEGKQKSLNEANQRILSIEKSKAEEIKKLLDEKETNKQQCNQLRILNRELEAQFNTQMDLIGALKRKLLAQQCEPGKPSWATATATRSCGSQSTEDEQYHSEGSEEGLGESEFLVNVL
uniref:Uncharacterized protein n=1 Tax=Meloidogyne javanica TaxID=6303 RepID=A0A915LZH3_MELJA